MTTFIVFVKNKIGGVNILIPNQKVEVSWGRSNSTHYKNKGYIFTKLGDKFQVKVEDLMRNSKAIVKIYCDECGKECSTTYQSYLNSVELHEGRYYCRKCVQLLQGTKDKIKQSIYDKYGVYNCMEIEGIVEKIKQTNLKNLGVEFPMQNEYVREKALKTLEQNGFLFGFKDPKTLLSAQISIANKRDGVAVSKQQEEVYRIVQENFKNYYSELNYPCENLNLDIALFSNNIKIDIETDGEYWHNDPKKDRKRDEFVKSKGYKVLRIRYNRKLPEKNEIINSINKIIFSNHSFYQIESDDCKNKNNN